MKKLKLVIDRQTIMIIGIVIVLTAVLVGVSFALFTQVDKNTTNQIVSSGTLTVNYVEGNIISGVLMPMSNAAGLATTGYSFTIQNTGTLPADYAIKIRNNVGSGIDSSNYLAHNQIYVSFNNGTPVLLSSVAKENPAITDENAVAYVLLRNTGAFEIGASATYNVKVWIRSDISDTLIGKKINLVLEVESTVNTAEHSGGAGG